MKIAVIIAVSKLVTTLNTGNIKARVLYGILTKVEEQVDLMEEEYKLPYNQ